MLSTDEVKDGDLLAFHGSGLISFLIRLRTSSTVTHVGCAYWLDGHLWVIEAREFAGVRIHPVEKYLRENPKTRIQHFSLEAERYHVDRSALVASALRRVRESTGYASVWQFIRSFSLLTRWYLDRCGLPIDTDPNRDFCSEFYCGRLNDAGYRSPGGRKLQCADMTPGQVAQLECVNSGRDITLGEL